MDWEADWVEEMLAVVMLVLVGGLVFVGFAVLGALHGDQ